MCYNLHYMKNILIKWRNASIRFIYKHLLKPIFFAFDPEDVHDKMISIGKIIGRFSITRFKSRIMFDFYDKSLEQIVNGIKFRNPIGLSAGFDKDAELLNTIPTVGFGFEEIGSITGFPCLGNPKPRLWRLKKSEGLVVYYGLKNRGAEEISKRLKNKKFEIPFGTNIAMTNCSDNLDISKAVLDYARSFRIFREIGDYFTVNVSCPNAEGGQPFMDPEKLHILLSELDKIETKKPIFVKISPDISFVEVDNVLNVLKNHKVDGIICTNLTKKKGNPLIVDALPNVGGVSGKPVRNMSDDLISYIYKKEGKRFTIIGVGGVFNAEDAYRKIRKGASLVELITGMIFEGPQLISEINQGLVKLLKKDGFSNISEAIGANYK